MNGRFQSLRTGIKWNALNAVSIILSRVLRVAVIPKILDPASYGLFTSVGIFTRYLQFSDFGAAAYFSKALPHVHFFKKREEERRLADHTYSVVLLSNLPVILYMAGIAIWYQGSMQEFYRIALLLLIPITIASKLKELYMSYALGIQDYRLAALASVANNYVSMFLVVGGVFAYGAMGGILGMLAAEAVLCWHIGRTIRARFRFTCGPELFQEWRGRLRLFIVSISDTLATTIDQIFVLKVFDARGFGFYSLGLSFAWAMEALAEVFTNTAYPKLMAIAREDRRAAAEVIRQTLYCYLLVSLVTIPALVWLIEAVVALYFDRYVEGLAVYPAMVFLGMSRGAMTMIRRGYVALDREASYIANTLLSTALYAVGLGLAWWQGLTFTQVTYVILAANVASLLLFMTRMSEVREALFWKNLGLLSLMLSVLVPYGAWVRPTGSWGFVHPASFGYLVAACLVALGLVYREWGLVMGYLK